MVDLTQHAEAAHALALSPDEEQYLATVDDLLVTTVAAYRAREDAKGSIAAAMQNITSAQTQRLIATPPGEDFHLPAGDRLRVAYRDLRDAYERLGG